MVKQRQKKKAAATTRRVLARPTGIPTRYPMALGDTMVVPFRFSQVLTTTPPNITVTTLMVLGSGTSTTGYAFLNDLCSPFKGLQPINTSWMITDLAVEVRATGVGGTANTFIAASYLPSNSTLESPPTDLAEVSQAVHYCESSLGTVGRMRIRPTDYFNDWRQTTDSDDSDSQCGVIQLYGSGAGGSTPVSTGVVTVSGTLIFCGFRK